MIYLVIVILPVKYCSVLHDLNVIYARAGDLIDCSLPCAHSGLYTVYREGERHMAHERVGGLWVAFCVCVCIRISASSTTVCHFEGSMSSEKLHKRLVCVCFVVCVLFCILIKTRKVARTHTT